MNSGADLYLPKPYEISDLIQWVEYFINGMAIAFKSVYSKAKEQESSKDEIKLLRELDSKQRQILNLFTTQKYITTKDIAEFFKFSPRSARLLALEWTNSGFLVAQGEGKQRKYMLGEKFESIV